MKGERLYDAVLLIGFGGPTSRAEVRPFLDNVLRGRPVPPERIETVVQHYEIIGGSSPFNELTFRQARALKARLRAEGLALPVFVGMRAWTPYVHDTLQQMAAEGLTTLLEEPLPLIPLLYREKHSQPT